MAKLQNKIIITPFLYNSSSLEELLTKYSNALRNSKDLIDLLHANKIDEIQNILKNEFNTNIKNFNIPAYLGDLLVTCYSTNSRNYKFGKYIITTNSINTALQKIGNMHVEGYDSLKYIHDNHVIHNIQKYLIFSKLIKKIFIN